MGLFQFQFQRFVYFGNCLLFVFCLGLVPEDIKIRTKVQQRELKGKELDTFELYKEEMREEMQQTRERIRNTKMQPTRARSSRRPTQFRQP